ncbi:MAG: DUF2065 family protein [Rhodobacteraceae bacterium]|jgi:uncharacterized protein YjeT (DUF2065 family)|nr:DUF2065 family protein [Paracoccaceae bacterium]
MSLLLLGIGLVLAIEGLALALAPARLEEILAFFARLPLDVRRLIGLTALAAGITLIWLAQRLGG